LRSASKTLRRRLELPQVHLGVADRCRGGVLVLGGMLFGAIGFDPAIMAAAVAALLGGIAVWGSNRSTAKEAAKELAAAETDQAALIEMIDLHTIGPLRNV
jgi:hypothetical protein